MDALLTKRRRENRERLEKLCSGLVDAKKHCGESACVYVTGSFGRGEASAHSDLDLFLVGNPDEAHQLSHLDEICVKADLIKVARGLEFPEFDGDGKYLERHNLKDLTGKLGEPDDDSSNKLTARLLLLLESRPVVGEGVYRRVIEEVICKYWRDYADHKDDFMPAFLANDILRLWRTFCVNYEARTKTDPADKKAKRKIKNYKLKHSRLLTCYSALLYLLHLHTTRESVHPPDVMTMVGYSPTERIEWIASDRASVPVRAGAEQILSLYARFLASTDKPEPDLIDEFLDPNKARERMAAANQLGDELFKLLQALGDGSSFFRLLVV